MTLSPDVFQRFSALSVPRYTSYPTAPHFKSPFSGQTVGTWLETLEPETPVSLYLHIPYCQDLCWYCGCNMKLVKRYSPIAHYVDTLLQEIESVRRFLPGRLRVSHLHFGGGTPTALAPADLVRVMDALHESFDLSDTSETAIESDPRRLPSEMARTIASLGFNRVSFGIQSFSDEVQRAINRIQPAPMVESAVDRLRSAGIENINFDLIYGLPHETLSGLEATLHQSTAMQPSRFALFGYAHVPWMARKQRLIDEAALPGTNARMAQAGLARRILRAAGYSAIGLDHFARPGDSLAAASQRGTLRRNFQGYTTDQASTLIAFGSSAIGRTPLGYYQNHTDVRAWTRDIEAGHLPVRKGHVFQGRDRFESTVIEALMCQGRADLDAIAARTGTAEPLDDDTKKRLTPLLEAGLATFDDRTLTIQDGATALSRVVASVFDRYLAQSRKARHSVAV